MIACPWNQYRETFVRVFAEVAKLPHADVEDMLEVAVDSRYGDLAFPCFRLAKAQRRSPAVIAKELSEVKIPGMSLEAFGPYVNIRFTQGFAEDVITDARRFGFARGQSGTGKTIVIDYSSPNIAKPIAFHHIRSTVIGHALSNVFKSQGYDVIGINYLGDWGTQFGLVAVGAEMAGMDMHTATVSELVGAYVQANTAAEIDPTIAERAQSFFRRMETGDEEALASWRAVREHSIAEFKTIYERLGISFDLYEGESLYHGMAKSIIEEIRRFPSTVGEDDGRLVVHYEEGQEVTIQKSDGTTLYLTRDVTAAIDRFGRFDFEKMLYVVSYDQALHFHQLFAILGLMGPVLPGQADPRGWVGRCEHVGFGHVSGMSTRKGSVVLLSDVLDEASCRAYDKIRADDRRIALDDTVNVTQLAEQIGVGAVLFGDLSMKRGTNYAFNWDEILNFEGHTGPYVQYAHARACNILAKGRPASSVGGLDLPEEVAVIRAIAKFPIAIEKVLSDYEASHIARSLIDVASAFSKWYAAGNTDPTKRVLVSDGPLQGSRMALVEAVRITLATGLALLGIAAPSTM